MSVQDIERVVKLMRRWRFDHERGYWIHVGDEDITFSDDRLAWFLLTVIQIADEIEGEEASAK